MSETLRPIGTKFELQSYWGCTSIVGVSQRDTHIPVFTYLVTDHVDAKDAFGIMRKHEKLEVISRRERRVMGLRRCETGCCFIYLLEGNPPDDNSLASRLTPNYLDYGDMPMFMRYNFMEEDNES